MKYIAYDDTDSIKWHVNTHQNILALQIALLQVTHRLLRSLDKQPMPPPDACGHACGCDCLEGGAGNPGHLSKLCRNRHGPGDTLRAARRPCAKGHRGLSPHGHHGGLHLDRWFGRRHCCLAASDTLAIPSTRAKTGNSPKLFRSSSNNLSATLPMQIPLTSNNAYSIKLLLTQAYALQRQAALHCHTLCARYTSRIGQQGMNSRMKFAKGSGQ